MRISAVIITKNEAKHIGTCIQSLLGVVDEVLVLDSFSTDGTQKIAQELGAKVLEVEWMGYAATKNYGNEQAQGDYILSMDADEALSEELKKSILDEKEKLSGVYEFNRLNHFADRPIRTCGWYPDTKIRLFPKEGAKWMGDFVHEDLVPEPSQTIHFLKGDLLHFTYSSREDLAQRARKYANLAAEKLAVSGKPNLGFKRVFSPAFRFIKMFFFQGGIMDGKYGLWICLYAAREVKWKYAGAIRRRKEGNDSIV